MTLAEEPSNTIHASDELAVSNRINEKTAACNLLWHLPEGRAAALPKYTNYQPLVTHIKVELTMPTSEANSLDPIVVARKIASLDRFNLERDSPGFIFGGSSPDDAQIVSLIVLWHRYISSPFLKLESDLEPLTEEGLDRKFEDIPARTIEICHWDPDFLPKGSNSIGRYLEIWSITIPADLNAEQQRLTKENFDTLQWFQRELTANRTQLATRGPVKDVSCAWMDARQVPEDELGTLHMLIHWKSWDQEADFKDPETETIGTNNSSISRDYWLKHIIRPMQELETVGCRVRSYRTEMKYFNGRRLLR
ncbi:hypothetical protein BDZ85DRAFT_286085 [Elsinoe ampelina]|uniref:Uncharacterized protein n=1 Tax=Elsinoe ampelina TaxID=302913 RepID=A0A6A6FYW3_9PEZI|nr:hypothetical protein BDZ85DRAFT_286085 [Elsinoe ampelina]